jgi:hypothetical protein
MTSGRRTALGIIASTAILAGSIALSACGGSQPNGGERTSARPGESPRVAARVAEYRIDVDRVLAPSGRVNLDIRNDGRVVHEVVVLRTDYAAGALPRDSRDRDKVDAYDAGTVVDDAEVAPQRTFTLRTTLKPGTYVLLCDLPGHYAHGMYRAFRVA